MKIRDMMVKRVSVTLMIVVLILVSCSKNNDVLNSNDIENINSESVSDSYTSETADMATSVVSNITDTTYASVSGDITGVLASIDSRLTGAMITISHDGCTNSSFDNPCGTITIDFGTVGVTANGVTRMGKISISYSGRKNYGQSTRILSYAGYSKNSVVFSPSMVFTITNTAAATTKDSTHFNHGLDQGKLTFPDGTSILREANYDVTINYIAKTVTVSAAANFPQSASGITRARNNYTMVINIPLVYKTDCLATKVFVPVSGEKSITIGGEAYKINYGNGTVCDNTVTVIVGGKSTTITVNSDGN